MHQITARHTFEAAHRLRRHNGACRNIHGHSYKLEVSVQGELQTEGPKSGMIVDFKSLKTVIKDIIDVGTFMGNRMTPFDHSIMLHQDDPLYEVLNTELPGGERVRVIGMIEEPTAEYMAELLAGLIVPQLQYYGLDVYLSSVKVWETEKNFAEWKPDDEK